MRGVYRSPLRVPNRDRQGSYEINQYGEIVLIQNPTNQIRGNSNSPPSSFRRRVTRMLRRIVIRIFVVVLLALLGAELALLLLVLLKQNGIYPSDLIAIAVSSPFW